MKKILLPLLCMAAFRADGKRELRATNVVSSSERSCGAAARLMADHYTLTLTPSSAKVNFSDWTVEERLSFDSGETHLRLTHRTNPDAYTTLTMDLVIGPAGTEGVYVLSGRTEDRAPCVDAVRLVGP